MSACAVKWCAAVTTGEYCAIHRAWPVERNESRDAWEKRLRAEDRAKKREEAEALARAEHREATGG